MKNFFRRIPKTPEEKKTLRNDRRLLILSGILLAAGFPPVPYPVTLFFALVPFLFIVQRRQSLLGLNRAAYVTAFVFSLLGVYWVGGYTEWKDPYLMISGVLLLFVNAVPFMIATTAYYMTRKYFSERVALWFFPVFWAAYEYIYTLTDWSFPWLNLGNGVCNFAPFIQIADLIGAHGLGLLVGYINLMLFIAIKRYRDTGKIAVAPAAAAVLLFILPVAYGIARMESFHEKARRVKAGVVQPNLDPYDKWAGSNIGQISGAYLQASQKLVDGGAEIIFWPETALPVYFLARTQTAVKDSVFAFVMKNNVPLLTGMPDIRYYSKDEAKPYDVKYAKEGDFYYATYNGIYLIQPGTMEIQRYGKMRLVPFGERVPFVDQIPVLGDLMRWGVGLSGWNVGQESTVFQTRTVKGTPLKIGGLVCYESIYGEMAAALARGGAQLLVVVTNDSWYGNTSGPYQHRDYAKLRAVETRRYVIRAANGGISCTIDPLGRIVSQTSMYHTAEYLESFVPRNQMTFYARHPDLIPTAVMMITVWLFGISLMRRIVGKRKPATE